MEYIYSKVLGSMNNLYLEINVRIVLAGFKDKSLRPRSKCRFITMVEHDAFALDMQARLDVYKLHVRVRVRVHTCMQHDLLRIQTNKHQKLTHSTFGEEEIT